MSNFEQSLIGHRCRLWADVKELYGPRSFCSSGGAAVYSYTGKVLPIHSLRHIYFLNGVHTESQVIRPAPARFFTLYLQSALARNARLLGSKELLPHETSRQIGTPALRAKIARDSLGTESRNEAGRTVIRNPCEIWHTTGTPDCRKAQHNRSFRLTGSQSTPGGQSTCLWLTQASSGNRLPLDWVLA
jgi:hypothetical protein